MRRSVLIGFSLFCGWLFSGCAVPEYDTVFLNGTLVDGSGGPAFRGDIAIRDGRIVRLGRVRSKGAGRVIDASGLYVTPGFIDMHTHCDNLREKRFRAALNYLTQGVTTVVTGSCGSGTFEVMDFFRTLEDQGAGVNVVHMVGLGRVRSEVMGQESREPRADELEKMITLVENAMREGAAGLSSGLFYAPGSFATTEEVIALLGPVHAAGGIYHTHLRDESNYTIGLLESIREAVSIGERAGVPVQISHIKALGRPVWGLAPEVIKIVEEARARGLRVFADQYPYPASSTSLVAAVIPRWVQAGGGMRERLGDPKLEERILREVAGNIDRRGGGDSLVISSFSARPEWVGRSLKDIAAELARPEPETAVALILMGGPGVVSFNQTDEDVEAFMRRDWVMTGSDGRIQLPGPGAPHPRSYGTFPRKIRRYVLEKGLLSMEQAIRSSSALPAEMLGLQDRGLLRKGFVADVVAFDPETLRDLATFAEPHQYSEGIRYVLIAGRFVIDSGEATGTLAGRPLPLGSDI